MGIHRPPPPTRARATGSDNYYLTAVSHLLLSAFLLIVSKNVDMDSRENYAAPKASGADSNDLAFRIS